MKQEPAAHVHRCETTDSSQTKNAQDNILIVYNMLVFVCRCIWNIPSNQGFLYRFYFCLSLKQTLDGSIFQPILSRGCLSKVGNILTNVCMKRSRTNGHFTLNIPVFRLLLYYGLKSNSIKLILSENL